MINEKIRAGLNLIPGIIYMLLLGLLAKYIGQLVPTVSYLVIAIALGIFSANFLNLPRIVEGGINKTHKLFLETGIVILGSAIRFKDIIEVGPKMLLMVIGFIIFSLLLVEYIAGRLQIAAKLGSCLAAGTSVCGVSAVIATGGAIGASAQNIAYAIATVITFDIITVFAYPIIGQTLIIPPEVYGPWAGVSMFSTGTTVAAGFAHSELGGQLATIGKMSRNVFIGLWALLYSIYYLKKGLADEQVEGRLRYLWDRFPKIVIGFVLTMVIANLGIIDSTKIGYLKNGYNWLFMMAFVGLGYSSDLRELKKTGVKPFLIVLIAFIIISLTSLLFSYLLFA